MRLSLATLLAILLASAPVSAEPKQIWYAWCYIDKDPAWEKGDPRGRACSSITRMRVRSRAELTELCRSEKALDWGPLAVGDGHTGGAHPKKAARKLWSSTCLLDIRAGRWPKACKHKLTPDFLIRGVDPGEKLTPVLKRIAKTCAASAGMPLHVSSGYREAASQAAKMYDVLANGKRYAYSTKEPRGRKKKRADLAGEVKSVYLAASRKHQRKGLKADALEKKVVAAMTERIEEQVAAGDYVSAHLPRGALDIRTFCYTRRQSDELKECIERCNVDVVDERDKPNAPHFHLNFDVTQLQRVCGSK